MHENRSVHILPTCNSSTFQSALPKQSFCCPSEKFLCPDQKDDGIILPGSGKFLSAQAEVSLSAPYKTPVPLLLHEVLHSAVRSFDVVLKSALPDPQSHLPHVLFRLEVFPPRVICETFLLPFVSHFPAKIDFFDPVQHSRDVLPLHFSDRLLPSLSSAQLLSAIVGFCAEILSQVIQTFQVPSGLTLCFQKFLPFDVPAAFPPDEYR